jgi:2-oxoglutarate dehydrogenase E2 component (dihydrolipoamide succinyltransferase)
MNTDPDSSHHSADDETSDSAQELSPAVRRLIRQYDIDLSAIRGSGPEGRIRVSDVMSALGNRGISATLTGDAYTTESTQPATTQTDSGRGRSSGQPTLSGARQSPARNLCTLIGECEVDALLAHVQAHHPTAPEAGLMLCVLSACAQARRQTPEIGHQGEHLVAELTWADADGHEVRWIADTAEPALALALTRAWLARDTTAPGIGTSTGGGATLALHWLGSAGTQLTSGLPVQPHHTASLAITAPQAKVVVRGAPGQEAARIRQVMAVILAFDPDNISLHRANHFLASVLQQLHSAFSTAAMESAT